MPTPFKSLVALLVVAMLLVSSAASIARAPRQRAKIATSYVVSEQSDDGSIPGFSPLGTTSDAVLSLVAGGRGSTAIEAALDYLEAHVEEAESVGQKAKLVLAAVAGGRDPSSFGGQDLVAQIDSSEQPDGRYGATTEVLNHALAMLALESAGKVPSAAAVQWLVDAQCRDGGWEFQDPSGDSVDRHCFTGDSDADFFTSETDSTAYAVQALEFAYAVAPNSPRPDKNPFRFLRARRDPKKNGWGYDRAFPLTNANSTALTIGAFVSGGRRVPKGAVAALAALQLRVCRPTGGGKGAFAYTWEKPKDRRRYKRTAADVGATVGAILGLLKRPLPIAPRDTTKPPPTIAC